MSCLPCHCIGDPDGTYTQCLENIDLSLEYSDEKICAELQITWGSDDYWGDLNG